jgi:hypothetical protein
MGGRAREPAGKHAHLVLLSPVVGASFTLVLPPLPLVALLMAW